MLKSQNAAQSDPFTEATRNISAALFPPRGRARRVPGETIRFTAYRIGEIYHLDPVAGAERVTLGMDWKCWLFWDADGDPLVCRGNLLCGFSLTDSIKVAWCWEVDPLTAMQYPGSGLLETFTLGECCRLSRIALSWHRTRLRLADGVWHETTECGEVLFYRGARKLGLPWQLAMEYGWCEELPVNAPEGV